MPARRPSAGLPPRPEEAPRAASPADSPVRSLFTDTCGARAGLETADTRSPFLPPNGWPWSQDRGFSARKWCVIRYKAAGHLTRKSCLRGGGRFPAVLGSLPPGRPAGTPGRRRARPPTGPEPVRRAAAPARGPSRLTGRLGCTREGPRHRRRRPRTRPVPLSVPRPRRHRAALRSRQRRYRRGGRIARGRRPRRHRRRRTRRRPGRPIWSSSVPRPRWSRASRTPYATAASRSSAPRPRPPSWRAPRRSPRT